MSTIYKSLFYLFLKLSITALLFYLLNWFAKPAQELLAMETWIGYAGICIYFIGEFIFKLYQYSKIGRM
jgi:hypothetical protein